MSSPAASTTTTIGTCGAFGWTRRNVVSPELSGRPRSSRTASTRPCFSRARPSARVPATSSRNGLPRIAASASANRTWSSGRALISRTVAACIGPEYTTARSPRKCEVGTVPTRAGVMPVTARAAADRRRTPAGAVAAGPERPQPRPGGVTGGSAGFTTSTSQGSRSKTSSAVLPTNNSCSRLRDTAPITSTSAGRLRATTCSTSVAEPCSRWMLRGRNRVRRGDGRNDGADARALALDDLERAHPRRERQGARPGHGGQQRGREERVNRVHFAVQQPGQPLRRAQDPVVERRRQRRRRAPGSSAARMRGRPDQSRGLASSSGAGQAADQVPVGVAEQRPADRGVVVGVLDDEVGRRLLHASQDPTVHRDCPSARASRPGCPPARISSASSSRNSIRSVTNSSLSSAQVPAVEERRAGERRVEVADEQLERRAEPPRQQPRLVQRRLHVRSRVDDREDPFEAQHDAASGVRRPRRPCGTVQRRWQAAIRV